jgi:CubicO group peptidase (beta-lactamase class C family)
MLRTSFLFLLFVATAARSDWQADIPLSFQQMDHYFPTRVVKAGENPQPLARSEKSMLPGYEYAGRRRSIEDFITDTDVSGLLVLHRGEILHESYHQGAGPETLFTSWSVAKSMTATLLAFARADGLIASFEDSITQYLPELSASAYKKVTIRQALQMSSGVAFDETYEDPESDFWVFMNDYAAQGRANAYLESTSVAHQPGEKFNYNTSETQLLGWLIHRVTGQSVSDYLARKIWQPQGMEADATWLLDAEDGMEITGIGVNAMLRDYARFGQMYVTGRGLPEGWVQEATRPSNPQVENGELYEGMELGYQYQWWSFPDNSFEAQGIHGQFIYVNPARELVVVVASAWPEPWVFDHELEFYALIESLNLNL